MDPNYIQESNFLLVNEAMTVYAKTVNPSSNSNLKEEISNADFFGDKMLVIQLIRAGLPYQLFNDIKEITPFSEEDWAEYLNLSTKTLQRNRKDPDFVFKPIHTEKIMELAEVTQFGNTVFDSTAQFYLWLNTPCFALGNLKPAELLKDSYGKELVMAELNRIEHGIFV
ncbi:type II RES/Xre toxin-antitoxin system antitoxin [Frigoriflavimonas asaccharolytica]|uniref:Putative toxin-antitoxin system antitoxin component (TIGR02293 family) n=1 Tax=Frigoriflavimonas asaccharolytica TaxID=2735899 RepID=A0A8J8K6X7_9FLAO|nr:antitoxin Xre/MbcA/ParS toxin-binding domain-containing protein [Frigoriflavimonas asaccharolytica]NRS91428.1 putative toxin-antitoxin system antitoxin component (TIGR02293 family) [Frigoriflavimonas asaccharolytica]